MLQEWISTNNVLSIVLRDSLHQPQYVEKLEKIIRFMIKEKTLTLEDLDKIWDAQVTSFHFMSSYNLCLFVVICGNQLLAVLIHNVFCTILSSCSSEINFYCFSHV